MVRVFKSRYLRHMWFSPSQSISSTKDAFSLSLSFSLKYSLCLLSLKIVDLNNTCRYCLSLKINIYSSSQTIHVQGHGSSLSLKSIYICLFSKRYGSMSWFELSLSESIYIRLLQRSTYKAVDRLSLSKTICTPCFFSFSLSLKYGLRFLPPKIDDINVMSFLSLPDSKTDYEEVMLFSLSPSLKIDICFFFSKGRRLLLPSFT